MPTFKPNGSLDINTDPTDLPDIGFSRCKNLELDKQGSTSTRKGSIKINATAMADLSINHIQMLAGTRYSFAGDDIYNNETSIISGPTDAQWSSIRYNSFNETAQKVFCLNGTDRKIISGSTVSEWGSDAPTDTIQAGKTEATNGLTGTYSIKFTKVKKSGTTLLFESSASSKSPDKIPSSEAFTGTFTRANEEGFTHVRVYRTFAGGSSWYYDDEYPIDYRSGGDVEAYTQDWESSQGYTTSTVNWTTGTNTDVTAQYLFEWESDFNADVETRTAFMKTQFIWEQIRYCSETTDSGLGTELEDNHDRPPLGSYVAGPNYNGTSFIIKDNLLYYSLPKQPEYWPSTYFIEASTKDSPGVALVFYNGQPYYLTKNDIYYIQGTGHPVFQPLDMKARTGCQGPKGAYTVDGQGIYHTGTDGLYLFAGGNDRKITKNNLDPIFTGTSGTSINGIPVASELTTAWIIAFKNNLYFGYTSSGNTYPTNVIVVGLDEPKRVSYYNYTVAMRSVAVDETNDRLIVGCVDGFIRQLETGTTDDGTAISWEIQSKDFTLQTRKHFPRWCKYDIDASSSTTCTGTLILDDVTHQSHTITGNRETNRRLVEEGNGSRCSINVSGTGTVTIHAAEFE